MIRSALLLLLTILVACSGPARSFEEILPATPGRWTRSSVSPVDPNSAPEIVRQLGLKRAAAAAYAGPAAITVQIYEMNTTTGAFELFQKWRQQDGRAVYTGPYFVVATATGPETAGLLELLRKELK